MCLNTKRWEAFPFFLVTQLRLWRAWASVGQRAEEDDSLPTSSFPRLLKLLPQAAAWCRAIRGEYGRQSANQRLISSWGPHRRPFPGNVSSAQRQLQSRTGPRPGRSRLFISLSSNLFPEVSSNNSEYQQQKFDKKVREGLKRFRFDKVQVLLLMTILHAQAACGQDTPRSWESLKYDSWPMSRILERFSPDIGKSAVFENILLSQCCPGVQYCSAS